MERIELELRELMTERAAGATEVPGMRPTLRRARRRQAATVVFAASVAVAVAGGVVGARTLLRDEPAPRIAAPSEEGTYSFRSTPGTAPVVATGEFRGATWELTATSLEDDIGSVELALVVKRDGDEARERVGVYPGDSAVAAQTLLETDLLDGASAVFGAVIPEVAGVDVRVAGRDDVAISAHRFRGERRLGSVDYFLAFVPGGSQGFVHARDELGIDLGTSGYGGAQVSPRIVSSGTAGDERWTLDFAGGVGEGGRDCFQFSSETDTGTICLTPEDALADEPMAMLVFEPAGALGIVGIISDEVAYVRLVTDEGAEHDLPWSQAPASHRDEWPVRIVTAGLDPAASGRFLVYDGAGELIDEQPFTGTPRE